MASLVSFWQRRGGTGSGDGGEAAKLLPFGWVEVVFWRREVTPGREGTGGSSPDSSAGFVPLEVLLVDVKGMGGSKPDSSAGPPFPDVFGALPIGGRRPLSSAGVLLYEVGIVGVSTSGVELSGLSLLTLLGRGEAGRDGGLCWICSKGVWAAERSVIPSRLKFVFWCRD